MKKADSSVWTSKPFIYIDSSVVIDTIDMCRKSSIHLMETIRDKKWENLLMQSVKYHNGERNERPYKISNR